MAHFLKKECGKNEDRATRKKISQAQLVNEWQCHALYRPNAN